MSCLILIKSFLIDLLVLGLVRGLGTSLKISSNEEGLEIWENNFNFDD